MKVIVCGDSFCAAELYPRAHFSQILVDAYNLNVINLARAGMSNVGIAFQLEHAVSLNPDIIIFNRTFPDRIEIVTDDISIDESIFLKHFCYPWSGSENFKTEHVGKPNAPIFSTVIDGLEDQNNIKLTDEKILAVKYWVNHLFNWRLKEKTDNWIIDYWANKIEKKNIRSIELARDNFAKPIYDFRGATTPFHTDEATQQWLANLLHDKIVEIKV